MSKGIVTGPYHFDSEFRLINPNGEPWAHQVPVEWVSDFPEVKILLGSEPLTVKELLPAHVQKLEAAIEKVNKSVQQKEAIEGEIYKTEAAFRSRNRTLIQVKKANSNYRCEVCGFKFEEVYGTIGHEYIIAHHLKPISLGMTKTTLDDIALLCANCHAMVHIENPPISLEDLRKLIARGRRD